MKRILRRLVTIVFGPPRRTDYERQWDSSDEDTQPVEPLADDEDTQPLVPTPCDILFTVKLFCTPGREQARWN